MILYHTTTIERARSILAGGLLASKSKGRIKAVWLHNEKSTSWALQHVMARHGGKLDRVCRMCVEVPRSWLRRFKGGVFYSKTDVPVARIVSVTTFEVHTRSLCDMKEILQ